MDSSLLLRNDNRIKRAMRVRKKVKGAGEKPRLSFHKTNQYIYVQIIDDETGRTLVSASSAEKEWTLKDLKNKKAAEAIGQNLGKRALEKGLSVVVLDRGRYKFHGVLATFADAARAAGLKF